jgi:hypothetical protein
MLEGRFNILYMIMIFFYIEPRSQGRKSSNIIGNHIGDMFFLVLVGLRDLVIYLFFVLSSCCQIIYYLRSLFQFLEASFLFEFFFFDILLRCTCFVFV